VDKFRLLVVDDYEPFRRVVRLIVELRNELQIIGEAADGLECIRKAQRLQPDVILLDIDLPKLNGIKAARRIRQLAPRARILFFSVESSSDIVAEAFNAGGDGYIQKLHVWSELLIGIDSLLSGERFVGGGLEWNTDEHTDQVTGGVHEMIGYSEDADLMERLISFVAAALTANNSAIVAVTKPHRVGLINKLRELGIGVDGSIERGRLIILDASEMLSMFMVGGRPKRSLFLEGFRTLINSALKAATAVHPRVSIFGECCGLLYADGHRDAAIAVEKMGNELLRTGRVEILCSYRMPDGGGQEDESAFVRICAEHSEVRFP
jgi:DNA-binding NarL/FixJ family response regulator